MTDRKRDYAGPEDGSKKRRTSKFSDVPPPSTQASYPLPGIMAPTPTPYTPAPVMSPVSGFQTLPPAVQTAFWELFSSGVVAQEDLDTSIYDSLRDFTTSGAIEIVDNFKKADLARVRNKTGFFIGILKQYRKDGRGMKNGSEPVSHTPSVPAVYSPYGAPQPPAAAAVPAPAPAPAPAPGGAAPWDSYQPYGAPQTPQYGYPPTGVDPSMHAAAMAAVAAATGQPMYDPYQTVAPAQDHAPSSYQPSEAVAAIGAGPQAGGAPLYAYTGGYDPYDPAAMAQAQADADRAAQQAQQRQVQSYQQMVSPGSGLASLPESVVAVFQHCFNMGKIDQAEVPSSIYDSMRDFEEDVQYQIIERFSKADLTRVRNKVGYLIGILKQARTGRQTGHGFGVSKNPRQDLDSRHKPTQSFRSTADQGAWETSSGWQKLGSFVKQRFTEMVDSNRIRQEDIDHCVFDSLADFSEQEQLFMVDNFGTKDLGSIRNKTAFFIGILKKQRQLRGTEKLMQQWA